VQLSSIRGKTVAFITSITRHQRTPASHILVLMISNEERNKKPYALPVQCILYKGLSDSKVRQIANKVISEMAKRGMKVAGKNYLNPAFCNLPYRIYYRWRMELPSYHGQHKTTLHFSNTQ